MTYIRTETRTRQAVRTFNVAPQRPEGVNEIEPQCTAGANETESGLGEGINEIDIRDADGENII